ncbi:MAG: NAD(+)/NADH kinase [Anaerovoracaceae bacterium]
MNKQRTICVYSNGTVISNETASILKQKLRTSGFVVETELSSNAELLVCIGGDGSSLEAIHKYDFPKVPIIGVNTGHLGFFQEIRSDQLDDFIFLYKAGKYCLQQLTTVKGTITTKDGTETVLEGLNEIVIRGIHSYAAHFNISIGGSFIERFSGDGILIATSAGSTAYNYSLGGSIVDPRLNLLQVTPIAPMNTTAFRSFTSSILLPSDLSLEVLPEFIKNHHTTYVFNDGVENRFVDVENIKVEVSDKTINLMRFETYDFWNKVKTKFL